MARNIVVGLLVLLLLVACIPTGKPMQVGDEVTPPHGYIEYQQRTLK